MMPRLERLGNVKLLGARVTAFALFLGLIAAAAPAPAASQEQDSLFGQYSVAIGTEELPTDVSGARNLVGRWQVTFNEDGTYSMARQDVGEVVSGTIEVDGQIVTITDEAGLLSCEHALPVAGADVPPETAIYAWSFEGDRLILTPEVEGCQAREILLATRALTVFVACLVEPFAISEAGLPDPDATPDVADSLAEGLRESGTPVAEDAPIAGRADPQAAIDGLLSQLTACWATGDPARILPLFSEQFVDELVEATGPGGSITDVAAFFAQIMVAPVTWERAGEVQVIDENTAEVVVIIRLGVEDVFQRFTFVFEEGEWRFADFGIATTPGDA